MHYKLSRINTKLCSISICFLYLSKHFNAKRLQFFVSSLYDFSRILCLRLVIYALVAVFNIIDIHYRSKTIFKEREKSVITFTDPNRNAI